MSTWKPPLTLFFRAHDKAMRTLQAVTAYGHNAFYSPEYPHVYFASAPSTTLFSASRN